MDRPVGEHIAELIATARATFHDVQVTRRDERLARALIDIEGRWGPYRIIISNLTDLTFPEVVEWVYETYFARVAEERRPAREPSLALWERGGEYKEDEKEG